MTTYSITNKNLYKIQDASDNSIYYGSNQDWYGKRWQRMAGCGPSTVTNIIYYLNCIRMDHSCCPELTKEECLVLMNEIWNYVTPSLGGVSSTTMLQTGVNKYLRRKNLELRMEAIDIPKKVSDRPKPEKVITFIKDALMKDCPVAFLNLERGNIMNLESWHWVTVISLTCEESGETAIAEILDSGIPKTIDLLLWLQSTKLGGGFVSFEM